MTDNPNYISFSGIAQHSFIKLSDVFSEYSELPSSNFNCLYKAKRFGKWHVLKGLKPSYRDKSFYIELLNKEFELGVSLNHPHIVGIVDKLIDPLIGPCIVMEYIDGETLDTFLSHKQTPETIRKLIRELLDAMSYYHSMQIVHRDLKPANILVTRNGNNIKIIDFGLSDSDSHTILKQPAGSRKYAAPEQYEEEIPIDCRADIYAFGMILKTCFGKQLPSEYRSLISRCCQPDREKRFANAGEVVHSLTRKRRQKRYLLNTLSSIALLSLVAFIFFWQRPTRSSEILSSKDTVYFETPIIQTQIERDTLLIEKPMVVEKSIEVPLTPESGSWEARLIDEAQERIEALYHPLLDGKHSPWKEIAGMEGNLAFKQFAEVRQAMLAQVPEESYFRYTLENSMAVIHGNISQRWSDKLITLPTYTHAFLNKEISEEEYNALQEKMQAVMKENGHSM